MPSRFHFNNDRIKAISDRPEKGRRLYFYDSTERGLGLAVTPAGTKTFFFHGRVFGRPERIPCGRFPEFSVDEARATVVMVRSAIQKGLNPREVVPVARRRRGGQTTLEDFWTVYMDEHARPKRARWETDQKAFDLYFGPIAQLPLDAITPDRLRAWHRQIGQARGEPTANKQINLLRNVFSLAMKIRRPDGIPYATVNPAAASLVGRFEEEGRDRFIRDFELPLFFRALAEYERPGARHFFQLALYTGARKTNLMRAAFDDIDQTHWVWTVPRPQFKGTRGKRHPHPIPLVRQAQHIVKMRGEMLGPPWVFPGYRANGRPIGNVNFWWGEILESSGLSDLRIHDLRRTIASWMAATGASYPIIAQFLGHSLPGATQIYARLAVEPVRDAVQVAVDKILEVAGAETE